VQHRMERSNSGAGRKKFTNSAHSSGPSIGFAGRPVGDAPSNASIPGARSPVAGPARSATQRKQERRRALIIICGMLLLATLTAVVVVTVEHPISVHSNSPQTATAMPDADVRTAKVTRDSEDGKGCWQQIFDNQSGRMTRLQRPCEAPAYESHGTPVPLGTIHRLEAISKSFSGH
jgi:hypothetical protein